MEKVLELFGYLVAGMLAFYLSEKRREWRARRKLLDELSPQAAIVDSKINALLAQLLFAVHGDKCKIFRFHNGGHYFSGSSVKKFSMTHLQLRAGVAGPNAMMMKDLNTSLFPKMMTELLSAKSTIAWCADDAPDDSLKSLHAAEGTEFVKIAALRSAGGELLGFVSINWLSSQMAESPERVQVVLQFAREIGLLLN